MPKSDTNLLMGKLNTEFKTVAFMVEIYCKDHHGTERNNTGVKRGLSSKASVKLCSSCSELLDYAEVRLDRCPYGEQKPACNTCPIHCYKPDPKAQMRKVMRYAGPRMLLKHPILAIRHLWLERQQVPELTKDMMPNRKKRQHGR